MKYLTILCFLILCNCSQSPQNRIVYGDTKRSIHDLIQTSIEEGANTLELEEGIYYLDSTIMISAKSINANGLSIRAKNGGKVILSGGKRVDWVWSKFNDSMWVAATNGLVFTDLFVNGEKQRMARYPNYNPQSEVYNGTAVDAILPEKASEWQNPKGGFIHALHKHHWGGYHYEILGKTLEDSLIYVGGWQNNRQLGMHSNYRFVENIFEELDAPLEWYHDLENKRLYYFPSNNLDLENAKIEVSFLERVFHIKGTQDKPISNIKVEGIEFNHIASTFMKTKEPLLRSDWTIYRNGAILLEGTVNCAIKQCVFNGIGGNGIFVSGYNRSVNISSCEFSDIGASGVCFVGEPSAVRNPNFEYHEFTLAEELDRTAGPKNQNYPKFCTVSDCLIRDIGRIEKQVAGIQIAMASDITVDHNTIYNTPRAGINIGDGCWGGHVIENNDVFNTVLETGDHGAFNSWGRDRFWYPNRKFMDSLILMDTSLILLDAYQTTIIRNNRFRCDYGWDIDLDDGSSNYLLENNICLSGGIKLREGFHRTVRNNIMINNSFHPHVWFKNSHDVFANNVVMANYKPIRVNDWGDVIDRNIFSDSIWLKAAQDLGLDSSGIVADLDFADPSVGNYKLPMTKDLKEIGFKNINNEFGVRPESLKLKSQKPTFSELFMAEVSGEHAAKTITVLGAVLKNIETMGEMSSLGVSTKDGVIVVEVANKSMAGRSGLLTGDVIVKIDADQCRNIPEFMNGFQTNKWKRQIGIELIRNQKQMKMELLMK